MSRPGLQLTPRDQLIIGYLHLVRTATSVQLKTLVAPNTDTKTFAKRLLQLSNPSLSASPPLLRHNDPYRRSNSLWTLPTTPGLLVATLGHEIQVAQLFVDLAVRFQTSPAMSPDSLPFRWNREPESQIDFFKDVPGSGLVMRTAIKPDATIDVPGLKRRYFIEVETGSQSITTRRFDLGTPGAVTAKLDRYAAFFTKPHSDRAGSTWYEAAYRDRFHPELHFVFLSPGSTERANLKIKQHLARIREPGKFDVRALTLADAPAHVAALIASRTPATGRIHTVSESAVHEIAASFNALLSVTRALHANVIAHNGSPSLAPIGVPPIPTKEVTRLSALIKNDLLSNPPPRVKWADLLVTTEKKKR